MALCMKYLITTSHGTMLFCKNLNVHRRLKNKLGRVLMEQNPDHYINKVNTSSYSFASPKYSKCFSFC